MSQAYIGGLFVDKGIEAVQGWLRPLLKPYIIEAYNFIRRQHGLKVAADPNSDTPVHAGHGSIAPANVLLKPDQPMSAMPVSAMPVSATKAKAVAKTATAKLEKLEKTAPVPVPVAVPTELDEDAQHGYLGLFNQHTTQRKMAIEWVFTVIYGEGTEQTYVTANMNTNTGSPQTPGGVATPIWTALAIGNLRKLGSGQGRTKKAAKNVAARDGLKALGVEVFDM
jgi:ribonuclease-3